MGLSERFSAISEFIAKKGAGGQKESAFDVETQQAVRKIVAEVRKSSGDPGTNQLFRDYKIAMGIPDRTRRTSFIGTRQYPSHLYRLLTAGVSLSLLLTACAPSPAVAAGESSGGTAPTAQSTRTTESTAIPTATRTTEATAGQTPPPEATPTPETGSNFKVTVTTATLNLRAKPTTASGILGTAKSGDVLDGFGVNRVIKADGTSQAWIAIKLADGSNAWVLDASYLVTHAFPTKDMNNLNADFTPLVLKGADTGGPVSPQQPERTATPVAAATATAPPEAKPTPTAPAEQQSAEKVISPNLTPITATELAAKNVPALANASEYYSVPGGTIVAYDAQGRILGINDAYEVEWTIRVNDLQEVGVISAAGYQWNVGGTKRDNSNVTADFLTNLDKKYPTSPELEALVKEIISKDPATMLIEAAALIASGGDVNLAKEISANYTDVNHVDFVLGWGPDLTTGAVTTSGRVSRTQRFAGRNGSNVDVFLGYYNEEDQGADAASVWQLLMSSLVEMMTGKSTMDKQQMVVFDRFRINWTFVPGGIVEPFAINLEQK